MNLFVERGAFLLVQCGVASECDRFYLRCAGVGNEIGQVGRFDRIGEHAVQPVIVGRWDGVELVVVTACAADGKAEERPRDDINPVIDHVMLVACEPAAECEKAECGKSAAVPSFGKELIASQLFTHETVVRHVVVPGVNHIVAVGVRIVVVLLFLETHVAFGVGVPGKIEPVPGPAFSVLR